MQVDSVEMLRASSLLPGKRVMAIFGFCDIHDFDFLVKRLETEVRTIKFLMIRNTHVTDSLCCLRGLAALSHVSHMSVPISRVQVMAFINKVAAIVHENTSLWSGACNKNMGNSFLLIWRIGEEKQLIEASRQDRRVQSAPSQCSGGETIQSF